MILQKKEKEFLNYLKTLGVKVFTNTKARGNKGLYRKNRIDISKNLQTL